MLVSTLVIMLVLIWQTPAGKPDVTLRIPMESNTQCLEYVKERLDMGMTEHEREAGFLGVGASCYTNHLEVRS